MSGRRQERSSARRPIKRGRAHKQKSAADSAVFERRVLMGMTVFTLLGTILWIVAISTDYWYTVSTSTPEGIIVWRINASLVRADVGLWRVCRTQRPVIDMLTNETGDPISRF
uniref:Uncharacterized protein n=1 Tax=Strigamia maritima TaxID=126957 RepID=T1JIP2_STRMM